MNASEESSSEIYVPVQGVAELEVVMDLLLVPLGLLTISLLRHGHGLAAPIRLEPVVHLTNYTTFLHSPQHLADKSEVNWWLCES